jgi:hypothetical protein
MGMKRRRLRTHSQKNASSEVLTQGIFPATQVQFPAGATAVVFTQDVKRSK